MRERLTYLKTVLLKKCPTYDTNLHLQMVTALAEQGDPEAREYLALRAAAYLLREQTDGAYDPYLRELLQGFPRTREMLFRHSAPHAQ